MAEGGPKFNAIRCGGRASRKEASIPALGLTQAGLGSLQPRSAVAPSPTERRRNERRVSTCPATFAQASNYNGINLRWTGFLNAGAGA